MSVLANICLLTSAAMVFRALSGLAKLGTALAGVLELVYRMVSNTIAERHVGSNPTSRTNLTNDTAA